MHKIDEFKGHKVLTLLDKPDSKYPFSFGIAKAKLILANYESIVAFVGWNGTKDEPKPPTPEQVAQDAADDSMPF